MDLAIKRTGIFRLRRRAVFVPLCGWEQYHFPAKGRNHLDGTYTSPKRDGLVLWMERANTVEHWSRHYPSPPICSGNNGASRYSPGRPMDRAQGGRDGWARAATGAASRWAGRTKVSSWLPLTPSSASLSPPCPALCSLHSPALFLFEHYLF